MVKRSDDRPEFCAFSLPCRLPDARLTLLMRASEQTDEAFCTFQLRLANFHSFDAILHFLAALREDVFAHRARPIALLRARLLPKGTFGKTHRSLHEENAMQFQAVQAILEAPQSTRHHRDWSRSRSLSTATLTSRCLFLLDVLRCLRSSQKKVASRRVTFEATEEMGLGAPPRFEQFGRPAGSQNPSSDDDLRDPAVVDRVFNPSDVAGRGSGRLRYAELRKLGRQSCNKRGSVGIRAA